MASDEKKCWVCEQPINDDELTLVSTEGVRHECRDVCLQALLQQLAECRRLLREAWIEHEEFDGILKDDWWARVAEYIGRDKRADSLQTVNAIDLTDYERAIEAAIPEMIEAVRRRLVLAAESRQRYMKAARAAGGEG